MQRPSQLSRRDALRIAALSAAAAATPAAAQSRPPAQSASAASGPREFTIDEANIQPRPIAIPELICDDPRLGTDLADVISADLERSGLFKPLDRAAFIERPRDLNVAPRFADWRAVGAEALLVGRVNRLPDGRVEVLSRIWDTVLGKELGNGRLAAPLAVWRRLAHKVADQVYEKLTLEKGYFDSRVVFIDETGPKDKRLKRLTIMDQDGANLRLLSVGRELVLTPRFSPVSQDIVYTSYTRDQPRVVVMNIDSGAREVIGDQLAGMTFAGRFSPDGQRVVMSFQQGASCQIVEMDLRSKQIRQLTRGESLDTAPCYAPDGRRIVFESDREGTQQLYLMLPDGSGISRLSTGDGRYSTPVWSPRGDYIAFTKQLGGSFLIGVIKPDGTGERVLTEGFHNEGPTWAPNGRVLMFFSDSQGATGGPHIFTIDVTGYNKRQVPTPAFASDPAWSPLLA